MTPTFAPAPPGNEKGRPLAEIGRPRRELEGTLPSGPALVNEPLCRTAAPSSSPRAIVRKRWQHHACRLWQLWIKTGNRRHFVAFRRHVDAMANNQNGGRP